MNNNKDYLIFTNIKDSITKIKPELEFIASISANHKPCFSTKTTIDKNSWLVTLKRRWNGEKGEKGVKYIADILKECNQIRNYCTDLQPKECLELKSSNCIKMTEDISEELFKEFEETINDFIDILTCSCRGLAKLVDTYNDQKNISKQYAQIRFQMIQIINDLSTWLYDFLSDITDLIVEKIQKDKIEYENNYYEYDYDDYQYYYHNYKTNNNSDQNNFFTKTYGLFSNFFNDAIDIADNSINSQSPMNEEERQKKIIDMLKSDNSAQTSFFNSEEVRMMGTPE